MYPPVTPNIKRSDIFPDYHFQVMDKHMLGGAPAGFIIVYLEGAPKIPWGTPLDERPTWRLDQFKTWMQSQSWQDEIKIVESGEWVYLGYIGPEIYDMYDSIVKMYFYNLKDAMFFKMVWG